MPRVRVTTRRLMIAAAVLAAILGLGLELTRLRALRLRERAEHHDREFRWLSRHPGLVRLRLAEIEDEARWPKMGHAEEGRRYEAQATRKIERRAEWHRGLRDKYEQAAGHPWATVGPDPPEPD